MSVRPVFLVIGSIAIVGVIGALVVRQTHGASDPGSAFMTSAAASPTTQSGPSFPTIPDGPRFSGRAAPASSSQIAQAPTPVQPRVVLPGGVPPAAPFAAGAAAPAATPAAPPAAAPAAAQAGSGDANTGEDGQATAAPQVDETALRYFARQGDTKRLEAEIARLKALYPDWYPPTDMTAPISVPDPKLDQMWKLYSTGRYAAARAAIADRVAREPGWHVPEDLLKRLDIGEAKDRLINAANAKQWNTVVQIAAATPSLLTCSDVDVLWRVAEAFAATERSARARDVGLYVLTNCQDPKERLATVQKAMQYLSDAELAELLALERVGADGRGEFAAVKTDLARRRVGAAAKDKATVAAPADLALIEQAARGRHHGGRRGAAGRLSLPARGHRERRQMVPARADAGRYARDRARARLCAQCAGAAAGGGSCRLSLARCRAGEQRGLSRGGDRAAGARPAGEARRGHRGAHGQGDQRGEIRARRPGARLVRL